KFKNDKAVGTFLDFLGFGFPQAFGFCLSGFWSIGPRQSSFPMPPLLHVVLHTPDIPQNTGNIGRTCVAVGAKLWLVRPLGFRLDQKQLRRAGLDYWQHLEWEVVDDWAALSAQLFNCRFWFFSKTATRLYTSVAY